MEFLPSSHLALPFSTIRNDTNHACFHPKFPYVYISISNFLLAFNIHTKVVISRWDLPGNAKFLFLDHSLQLPYLTAFTDTNEAFVWSTVNHHLELVSRSRHTGKESAKPIIGLATASTTPHFFYIRRDISTLFSAPLGNCKTTLPKFECKKPISCFTFLPGDTIAALATTDGRVVLLNYQTATVLCASEDFARIEKISRVPQFLLFDFPRELLYVVSRDGMLGCWQAFQDTSSQWRLDRFSTLNFAAPIRNCTLNHLGPLHVFFEDGSLLSFVVHSSTSSLTIQPTGMVKRQSVLSFSGNHQSISRLFMIQHPRSEYAMFLPCVSIFAAYSSSAEDLSVLTSRVNFFSDFDQSFFLEDLSSFDPHGSSPGTLTIYRLFDPQDPDRYLPVVAPLQLPTSFFLQQKPLFTYSQVLFPFVDSGTLVGYDMVRYGLREIKDLPEVDIMYERPLCVRRIIYSHRLEQMLVFYEVDIGDHQNPVHRYSYFSGNDESLKEGSDGCFLGMNHSHVIVLTANGKKVKMMPTSGDSPLSQSTPRVNANLLLEFPSGLSVRRIFPSPQPYGVLYYISTPDLHGLFPSFSMAQGYKDHTMQSFVPQLSFEIDTSTCLPLEISPSGIRESVIDVRWQSFSSEDNPSLDLAAVLTTRRIIIINAHLQVITALHSSPSTILPFLSCMWIDTCILYTTQTHLNYLSLDGVSHPISSLPSSILCAVNNDRVYAATREGHSVSIQIQNVGLLEPLVHGLTAARNFLNISESGFQELFQRALRRFDNVRITSHLLENLRAYSRSDVAFALIKNSSLQVPNTKFSLALKSRQFETAFDILRQKYKAWYVWHAAKIKGNQFIATAASLPSHRSTLDPLTPSLPARFDDDILSSWRHPFSCQGEQQSHILPVGSPLYQKFSLLARVCAQHGQFELARRCYVLMDDRLALLWLYVVHCSKLGVEAVNQVSKRDFQYSTIKTCERLLKVRHLFNTTLGSASQKHDDHSQDRSQDESQDEEPDQVAFTEYSQLGLKNWSFVTPNANWDTTQITSATMRAVNRNQLHSFLDIEPVGFLDSIAKWFPKTRHQRLPGKSWTFGAASRDDELISPGRLLPTTDRKTLTILPLPCLSLDPLPSVPVFLDISTTSRTNPHQESSHPRQRSQILPEETIPDSKRIELSPTDYDLIPLRLVSFLLEDPAQHSRTDFSVSFPSAALHLISPRDENSTSPRSSVSTSSASNPVRTASHPPAIPPLPPIASAQPYSLRQDSLNRDQRQPQDYVLLAWKKLEIGQYPGAVEDMNHAIRLFIPPSTENTFLIKFCALYKLALRILIEMKLLHQSSDKDRLLQLSVFLADVPILPAHRVEFLEKAIHMCLEASRIETARRLFKLLQTMQPANIEKLRKQLMQSRSTTSSDLDATLLDTQSRIICYQSLQSLPVGAPYLKCQTCMTCFSEKEKKFGEICAVCMTGKLSNASPLLRGSN